MFKNGIVIIFFNTLDFSHQNRLDLIQGFSFKLNASEKAANNERNHLHGLCREWCDYEGMGNSFEVLNGVQG